MMTNVQGTVNVLEAARRAKVKKFVYAASASCYGKTKNIVAENTKISLEHPYALVNISVKEQHFIGIKFMVYL